MCSQQRQEHKASHQTNSFADVKANALRQTAALSEQSRFAVVERSKETDQGVKLRHTKTHVDGLLRCVESFLIVDAHTVIAIASSHSDFISSLQYTHRAGICITGKLRARVDNEVTTELSIFKL